MVNIDNKLAKLEKMVDKGQYFVINRPRQYGKTTTMYLLEELLKEKYIIISMSFEGFSDKAFADETKFSNKFLKKIISSLKYIDNQEQDFIKTLKISADDIDELSDIITQFIGNSPKEVVLLIDEVDKFSNNQLFLSFLGMLRNKYLQAKKNMDKTFKSIILAGVHDITNLKIKFRSGEEIKLNSPWNIAVNFDVDMSFNEEEIATMIQEYCDFNVIKMDVKLLSHRLYYYSHGYPFLVSRLCQIIDENIVCDKIRAWTQEDIDLAVKEILKESNTLFNDLIKNIENRVDIYSFIEKLILNGDEIPFTHSDFIIASSNMYGIIRDNEGQCKINNKIFELLLYNHMTSKVMLKNEAISKYNFRENFINIDGSLDVQKILLKFQQFMKEQYSDIDSTFIEREGRLLFLAFIKPIINGVGFDFKEVQISEEKRLDIVITYNQFRYIIELKIWNGQKYHEKGIMQLCNYLNTYSLNEGYLVIFSFNKNKEFKQEKNIVNGNHIFAVYV